MRRERGPENPGVAQFLEDLSQIKRKYKREGSIKATKYGPHQVNVDAGSSQRHVVSSIFSEARSAAQGAGGQETYFSGVIDINETFASGEVVARGHQGKTDPYTGTASYNFPEQQSFRR